MAAAAVARDGGAQAEQSLLVAATDAVDSHRHRETACDPAGFVS